MGDFGASSISHVAWRTLVPMQNKPNFCTLVVCSASPYPVALPDAFQTGDVDVVGLRFRRSLHPDTA